ncbi:AraC family transcriptional regulator [Rapidithrix thailandica]|uniref:AraC family transcriptional regulator n=1 Tax=Rapidithrix thailandica TaxID=413964 RepID=A0AAW9RTD5_9BACT
MNPALSDHIIKVEVKNIGLSKFDNDYSCQTLISPISRIYLITQGDGWVQIADEKIILAPGHLYLIPSFTSCSYFFNKNLEHYYIHFRAELMSGLNVYSLFNTIRQLKASKLDWSLCERLLELNPNLQLPSIDPKIYQTKEWLSKPNKNQTLSHIFESRAIVEQLLCKFIKPRVNANYYDLMRYNLNPVLLYIQNHLSEPILVHNLAKMIHLSPDHFSRIFKKIVGYSPGDFIIFKRLEKAKLLLLTTDKPIKNIIEESGFKSLAHFSRLFKSHTLLTPSQYRKMRGDRWFR